MSSSTSENKENVHFGLAREAQWASTVIQALTQMTQPDDKNTTKSVVPRISIARAKGLAFFEQNKYGAVLSVTKSRGFLIRNLGWKDGTPQWSAPVFMEMTTGGLGLSLGYETAFSCIVLNTEEAIDDLVRGKPVVGFDVKLQASEAPTAGGEDMQLGDEMDDEEEVVVYSVAHGRMIDVSLQGGAMMASSDNARYYSQASPQQLLSGEVPAPKEFGAVYASLSSMATAGMALVAKLRDAGVRVYDVSRAPAGYRSVLY